MKFVQVFNRYLMPGGEETSVARIARHLERGGHQVTPFWRSSTEWTGPGAPARLRQLFLMWRNSAILSELADLHSREKPDGWILHNVVPVISLGVYRLAHELGVPIIQWLHNYRPLSPSGTLRAGDRQLQPDDLWIGLKETLAGSWRGRFLTGWLSLGYALCRRRGDFRSVRAWITVSEEMRSIFARAGLPPERLFTLQHSWDIRPDRMGDRDDGYFLYLGRMIETKGARFLIELWRRDSLKNLPLIMAGDGPLFDEFRKQTPKIVRWVGFVKGEVKRNLMAGCRAVLFPSLWPEPLSTVVYEAYEMGKPIISSNVGGMKEIVFDRQTGRLLCPGDAAAWREAILHLAHDPAIAHAWGGNGRKWLEEQLTPEQWSQKFDGIMQRVAAGQGAR